MKSKIILLGLLLINLNLYSQIINKFKIEFNNIELPTNNNIDVYIYYEDSTFIKSMKLDFDTGGVIIPIYINDSINKWLVVKYQDYYFTHKLNITLSEKQGVEPSEEKIYTYFIKYKDLKYFYNNTNSENYMIDRFGKMDAFYTISLTYVTYFYPIKNKKIIQTPPDFKKKKFRKLFSY